MKEKNEVIKLIGVFESPINDYSAVLIVEEI